MSHQAIIARITVTKVPEFDNLLLGKVLEYQVLVGKDTKDGELGIFFYEDLALSQEFAEANNLLRKKNSDGTYSGYFEANRRVRVLKFRGFRSEGFWCPLSHLSFTRYDLTKLKEGELFDELNKVKICEKYFNKATLAQRGPGVKKLRGELKTFPKHMDTLQFKRDCDSIPVGSKIIITRKIHGTSARSSNCLVEKKLRWWERILNRFIPLKISSYEYVNGTRNVIIDGVKEGFHSNEFRQKAASNFLGKLHKGEVVYYECYGWEKTDVPIMDRHHKGSLKEKELKKYPDTITYTYGLPNGQFDIMVYRICYVNEDGFVFELPWEQVKARCDELDVKHVPELTTFDYTSLDQLPELKSLVEKLSDEHGPYEHPSEGVVVRAEHGTKIKLLKLKSFLFRLLEGITKESETYVDKEDIS